MTKRMQILALVTLLLASSGLALEAAKQAASTAPFAVANVRFEQNATDGDAEVVFEVKGGKEGLAKLAVVSPDGRTVIDFTAPDASTLGIRQFRFETPEPRDVKGIKSASPEGVYTFAGATAGGSKLHGKATLNHKLPATTSFLQPKAGARGVSVKEPKIAWAPVKEVAAYIIDLQQRKLGLKLTARVPGSVATFALPEGFLLPGMEYKLAIGTVSDQGNISFVETTFTTGS